MSENLDVEFVRRHFPALGPWGLFENAGGTLVPTAVIARVADYMTRNQVQPGAGYPASAEAAERVAAGQRAIATMINAAPDEVMIGPSTTMNVYLLARALRHQIAAGDEIVVTNLDHEANNGAWRRLAAETGAHVREWRIDPQTAELDLADLEALLGPRTRLVCVTQCSNITGSINDAARITALAHAAGARVCIDAVAYAPHRAVDVRALDVDFYLCSLYKLYGPHLGLLYGKREHLLAAEAQNHYFIGDDEIPLKLNPGGVNFELTASLSGIADYIDAVHAHHFPGSNADLRERYQAVFKLFAAHEESLARPVIEYLADHPQVHLYGRPEWARSRRVPTISFTVADRSSPAIAEALLAYRVGVGAGDFYAARCIDAIGARDQGGVVRASMVHYTSHAEVTHLLDALDAVL